MKIQRFFWKKLYYKRTRDLLLRCARLSKAHLCLALLLTFQLVAMSQAIAAEISTTRSLTFSNIKGISTNSSINIVKSILYLQVLRDVHKDLSQNKVLAFGIKEDFLQMALISQLYMPFFQVEMLKNEPRGDVKISVRLQSKSEKTSFEINRYLSEKTLLDMRLEWLTLLQENSERGEDYLLIASGVKQKTPVLAPQVLKVRALEIAKTLDALWLMDEALGFYKERWQEPKKVADLLQKAVKLNDKLALLWACLGEVQLQLDATSDALKSVNTSLALQNDRGYALYIRGLGHLRLKQPSMAKVDFDAALALEPDTLPWLRARGATLMILERYEPMCKDFNRACSLGDCEGLMTARKRNLCMPPTNSNQQ